MMVTWVCLRAYVNLCHYCLYIIMFLFSVAFFKAANKFVCIIAAADRDVELEDCADFELCLFYSPDLGGSQVFSRKTGKVV